MPLVDPNMFFFPLVAKLDLEAESPMIVILEYGLRKINPPRNYISH